MKSIVLRTYMSEDLNLLSPGTLLEDVKAKKTYITYAKSSGDIGLLDTKRFVDVECEIPGNILWPLSKLPKGSSLTIFPDTKK